MSCNRCSTIWTSEERRWQTFGSSLVSPTLRETTPLLADKHRRHTLVTEPVSLNAKPVEETTESTELADPPAVEATATPPPDTPLGWSGPLTPDGEPFHDLGVVVERPLPSIQTKRSITSLPIR